jgi:hypothetical protein
MKPWIVPFAVAALACGCQLVVPAKPTADGSVICIFPQPGGTSFCQAATNLTAKEVTNQTSLCTSMQGTVVTACPAGAVGCCATTSGSVDFDQCFYGVPAATEETACATKMGTWAAGSGTSDAGATD